MDTHDGLAIDGRIEHGFACQCVNGCVLYHNPHCDLHGRNHGTWPQVPNRRITFKELIHTYWVDYLMLLSLTTGCLMVFLFAPPYLARDRFFPLYNTRGEIADPSIAYPKKHMIVPLWASIVTSIFIPILFYFCMFLKLRSFWDLSNAIHGHFHALLSATIFQLILKTLIGGFRPHFLSVCQPNPGARPQEPQGFGEMYYSAAICTGKDKKAIREAMESFPSGHTTAAFAAAIFLTLYLNAKLKLLSDVQAPLWKLLLTTLPLLGAFLVGGTLTIDGYHQPSDIIAGALIGTGFAFMAYRASYAAVWDFRFNHFPLSRHQGFTYSARELAVERLESVELPEASIEPAQ